MHVNYSRAVEATIDEQGNMKLLEPIQLAKPERAFVVILNEEQTLLKLPYLAKRHSLNIGLDLRRMLLGNTYNTCPRGNCLSRLSFFRFISSINTHSNCLP